MFTVCLSCLATLFLPLARSPVSKICYFMHFITSNKGICTVRFWSFLMRRASRSRGDWVRKKNIPAPEGLTYTGRVLVRFVGVYGDNITARQWARNVLMGKKRPVVRIINQKVVQWFTRRAQILFMKVKWEHQNAARKSLRLNLKHRPSTCLKRSLSEKVE